MHAYEYIYIYIYGGVCAHVYIRGCIRINTYIYIYMRAIMHSYMYVDVYTYTLYVRCINIQKLLRDRDQEAGTAATGLRQAVRLKDEPTPHFKCPSSSTCKTHVSAHAHIHTYIHIFIYTYIHT